MAAPLKLREWLSDGLGDKKQVVVCAGVYDMLTARIALAQGFKCLHLSNAATAMARSGVIGSEGLSQEFALELAKKIREIDQELPLIGELDRSLEVESVNAAVKRSHETGLAAIQLEDRLSDRCCKIDPQKNKASADTFLDSIQAAKEERLLIGSDMVIIAKSNVVVYCGCDGCFARAISRLQKAVDAGADVVLLAGSYISLSDMERVAQRAFKGIPVMVSPYNKTTEEAKSTGVKIISYPELFTRALYQGVLTTVRTSHVTGKVEIAKTVRCPDKTEDIGGLRDLLDAGDVMRH